MIKDTFALFQPGLWQEQGLITVAVTKEEQKPSKAVFRKMEKWLSATTTVVALSAVLAGSLPMHTSFMTSSAGATGRFVIGMKGETGTATIKDAEVPAGYWSKLAQEVATWPRLSVKRSIHDDPEPMA